MQKLTPEQDAILETAANKGASVLIAARAGCGKTSTLVMVAQRLHELRPQATKLALAFNVRIRNDLEKRISEYPSWKVRTFNGHGNSVLLNNSRVWNNGDLTLEPYKNRRIVELILGSQSFQKFVHQQSPDVANRCNADNYVLVEYLVEMMNFCKTFGYKGESITIQNLKDLMEALSASSDVENPFAYTLKPVPHTLICELLRVLLKENVKQARNYGTIDFADQIYLSTLYSPNPGPSWDIVMVDEAQDASPLNHIQVLNASKAQLIVCGDNFQSIYGWRGAADESMTVLTAAFETKKKQKVEKLSLTRTFRCSKSVVARQKHIVKLGKFQAAKPNAIGDIQMPYVSKVKRNVGRWSVSDILSRTKSEKTFILSAHNAPLFAFLAAAASEKIDIDTFSLMGHLPSLNMFNEAASRIKDYHQLSPQRKALRLFMQQTKMDPNEARNTLLSLYNVNKDTGSSDRKITLTTVHGAKGLEAPYVWLLEPELIGSKGNLRYVAETRTSNFLGSIVMNHHTNREKFPFDSFLGLTKEDKKEVDKVVNFEDGGIAFSQCVSLAGKFRMPEKDHPYYRDPNQPGKWRVVSKPAK